jgi:hypothetical protein
MRPYKPRDDVKPEHEWIDGELTSWGRWMRRRQARVRCGSAEGQYRSPWRQWHYPSIEELMPAPLDEACFWAMERAMLTIAELHRKMLVAHYVSQSNPHATCRKVKIRAEQYGKFMSDARSLVLCALRKTVPLATGSGQNLTTGAVAIPLPAQFDLAT